MDTEDVDGLVEDLTSNIDDLELSLAPLLKTALAQSTSKLPLLDKCKLYVLATYAIESILFSYLRLNGVDAISHPVYKELARVKEYFGKIKAAETAGQKRSTTLDKEAANRFIKHGLAGNEKYDRERSERIAREKAGAKRKLDELETGTHSRFDGTAKRIRASEAEQNAAATEGKARSGQNAIGADTSGVNAHVDKVKSSTHLSKEDKKAAKRQRRAERRAAQEYTAEGMPVASELSNGQVPHAEPSDKEAEAASASEQAPKSSKEELEALLDDSVPQEKKGRKRKKRKVKGQELEDERAAEMK